LLSVLPTAAGFGTLARVTDVPSAVQDAVSALREELRDDLFSCCIYGSAVREDVEAHGSSFNLLIVLRHSDVVTQSAVTRAIGGKLQIAPFVLGRPGFERSVRAFAAKFASIRRHYRVLHGEDPLAGIQITVGLERFLCEQALRNLRLRLSHSFITHQRHSAYSVFLSKSVVPIFLRLSEILRLDNAEYPTELRKRVPILASYFNVDASILSDLLELKASPKELKDGEAEWHRRTLEVLNAAIGWIEAHWPAAERVE
jgi:hypothetical protein